MKFQELLFDNQDKTQFDDMLSQILSELDLMVGSEIDEFGWFLTDYFDDPEEFSNNIEVFTKEREMFISNLHSWYRYKQFMKL